jgi:NAD(P)-dependent dehydrogenase (short-subunit alcohol dehydrogenase family)
MTSKAGVIGFTRALAREVGDFGITVKASTPGMMQSEMPVASASGNYPATRIAGRGIERAEFPADLVGAVMFYHSKRRACDDPGSAVHRSATPRVRKREYVGHSHFSRFAASSTMLRSE